MTASSDGFFDPRHRRLQCPEPNVPNGHDERTVLVSRPE
jgi:hypothetical protein